MNNTNGQDGVVLSKTQRKARNKAARAAAAAAAAAEAAEAVAVAARGLFPNNSSSRPSAFVKLPASILAQIVSHLYPEDVIYLAQANKSIYKVLMSRSAAPMWRACIENVGLPPCPPELSEPKYAFLLFRPGCTSCGWYCSEAPNLCLLVRLCPACNGNMFIDWETIEPAEVKQLVLSIRERPGLSKKSLKRDVENVRARFLELQSSGDKESLEAWVLTREGELQRRRENEHLLKKLQEKICKNRMEGLKQDWRQRAERALLTLGYPSFKDEDLPDHERYRWKEMMERPISWTENNWNNHKSEIIQFVKNPTRAQNARRSARNVKLRELLDCIGHTINSPLDNSLVLSEAPMAELMAKRLPLPTYGDVLEWPIVKSLVKKDAPISEMVCEFEIQKREITRLIIEWGERVKRELANMLREGREKEGLVADPPRLCSLAGGTSMNSFGNLDRDTRLLFRADAFFNVNPAHYNAIGLQSFNLLAKPAFATTGHKLVYTSNNKAPLIAQKLLLAMGHPEDAASVEFGSKWFACGRCHGPRRTWSSLVAHFLKQADDWEYAQKRLPEVAKSDVVYNDIHDPGFGTTPLVKCPSPEEAAAWESKAWETAEDKNEDQDKDEDEDDENDSNSDEDTEDYRFACRLCMEAGIESPMSTKVENIFPHITKVHAISDLQNGDVDEPFDWVTENPYVCVLEEMGGMGWCLIDG